MPDLTSTPIEKLDIVFECYATRESTYYCSCKLTWEGVTCIAYSTESYFDALKQAFDQLSQLRR